tara:strand:+ start:1608 stop:2327 length:720 start_codon:yes stop_codon:yes gene_type:complete
MPDLYSTNRDGYIISDTLTTWNAARNDTDGNSVHDGVNNSSAAVEVSRFGSRGGGNTFRVARAFLGFDTSQITGTVTSATLKIYPHLNISADIIVVKSSWDRAANLQTTDFDEITGFVSGSSMAGNVTDYSSETVISGTGSYQDITLNSTAASDIETSDDFEIAIVEYDHDYLNSAPTRNGTKSLGMYFTDNPSTSKDPYIEYAVTTGYGQTVNGVIPANIKFVNAVSTGDIEKIISVD